MIDGLESLLMDKHRTGVPELQVAFQEMLGTHASVRLVSEEILLHSSVYRLRFEVDRRLRSFVVKRLSPSLSELESKMVNRWLPLVGLHGNGPPLVGAAAEKTGRYVWHIYADMGDASLPRFSNDETIVQTAIAVIANVHVRCAGHAMLGECRQCGANYTTSYYSSCVLEARHTLEQINVSGKHMRSDWSAVVAGLLEHVSRLADLRFEREEILAEHAGPETLLHGDLWAKNVLVQRTDAGIHVRLIDWDRAGVGPVTFDLSTLLMRFPGVDRLKILDWYQEAIDGLNWKLPDTDILNVLFETAEHARLASAMLWPAISAAEQQVDWAFEELAEINRWLESVKTVLPAGPGPGNRIEPAGLGALHHD